MGAWQEHPGAADDLWRQLYRSRAECRPLLSEPRAPAGLRAPGNRTAGEPHPAATGRELSSVLVRAIRPAKGPAGGAVLSAAGDRRAVQWGWRPAAGSSWSTPKSAVGAATSNAAETTLLKIHHNKK